jgi:zona occludens toxin (predicted ATPase)
MSLPIPGLRPPLLSGDTVALLNKFRAFRHVFRNIYGFQLDAGRTLELLRDLNRTVLALNIDLDRFLSEIDRAVL